MDLRVCVSVSERIQGSEVLKGEEDGTWWARKKVEVWFLAKTVEIPGPLNFAHERVEGYLRSYKQSLPIAQRNSRVMEYCQNSRGVVVGTELSGHREESPKWNNGVNGLYGGPYTQVLGDLSFAPSHRTPVVSFRLWTGTTGFRGGLGVGRSCLAREFQV